MAHRYGILPGGTLVAGAWEETDALSNSAEQLKLSFGAGTAIRDFIQDDKGQWPDGAGGTGYALVRANPGTLSDPVNPLQWRLSTQSGGTLGQSDRISYAAWAAPFGSPGAAADSYGDRAVNLMEYTLGSLPNAATFFGSMAADVGLVGDIAYGQIPFVRNAGADDAVVVPQWSTQPENWSTPAINFQRVSVTPLPDGTVKEISRSSLPLSQHPAAFFRLKISSVP